METKFTPGPWRIEQESEGPAIYGGPADDPHYRVCGQVDLYGDNPQFAANGHLIAAAPDLYAALIEMIEVYWGAGDGLEPPPAVVSQATTALAKARGETA